MVKSYLIIAGGVGGAKIAEGFASYCNPKDLSIIGNVGDDWEFHGLWVSPDIDTLTYTLSGLIDRERGWGVSNETFRALGVLEKFGRETWMQLGDQDLGLHIYRTERRRKGDRPSIIAKDIARALGVNVDIILPTDQPLNTMVKTSLGWLPFQEYFVKERCKPIVEEISFEGADSATITPEAMEAIRSADVICIAPSNPIVSIGPIFAIPEILNAIKERKGLCIAVSPLIGGKAIKGPAVEILQALGHMPDSRGIAKLYHGLIDVIVIDEKDKYLTSYIEDSYCDVWVENTLMLNLEDKINLTKKIIQRAENYNLVRPK
ncbi:MAG: 2-phospho-L-lactate transferase [Alphaproteobacteria bacterium]|nr:2-phospho-L-lactate transferase [Alphaproteobacteria bacterium]|tara:strand:+ start:2186 stop:3142 length:957 start_codon:yes stop_codon:yes gene_type:complete